MAQPGATIVKVTYSVFEDNKGERYLSPDVRLLDFLDSSKNYTQINGIKTAKTIKYLLLHSNMGNSLNVVDVSQENVPIPTLLSRYDTNLIKTENNIKHLIRTSKIIEKSKSETGGITKDDNIPMEYNTYISNNMDSKRENNILKIHLNYYLNKLGLKEINNIEDYFPFNLSTLGDKLLAIDLITNCGIENMDQSIIYSNKLQQFAMASLGFIEFLYNDEHLGGTFFEAIYTIAKHQNNQELTERMLNILINHIPNKNKFKFPEYK